MLRTLEATITQNGLVKFNEPYTLDHTVKAYITILPDTHSEHVKPSSGQALLQILSTEPFTTAPMGDAQKLAQQIEQNRNAWNN